MPRPSPPTLKVIVDEVCRPVLGGNPTVNLDPVFLNSVDYHELSIPTNTMTVIDQEYTKGSNLLLNTEITSDNTVTCDSIANPADSLHKSFRGDCDTQEPGDCDHYLENGWRHPTKPVFGLLDNDVHVLFDSRLQLDENTITNPLVDGGGNKVFASTFSAETTKQDASPRPSYYCSNAPQDIFNEEGCYLSFDPNVCTSFDIAVIKAITFDEETLQQMFELTDGRYVYAVKGKYQIVSFWAPLLESLTRPAPDCSNTFRLVLVKI